MADDKKSLKLIIIALIWVFIAACIAVGYKVFVKPTQERKVVERTASAGSYKHEIDLHLDSFSGYALLRSPAFEKRLKSLSARLNITDDGADYNARIKALEKGDANMAVFTVDSFLAAGTRLGKFPGSIVLIIDETKGADAIVGKAKSAGGIASLQDLNRADARIVATPDSPSEFLARVAIASFNLPDLPKKWLKESDGAADAYKQFRAAPSDSPEAYVLWEPYVTRALEEPGATLLLDSSKLRGYILDVLVVERSFLANNHDLVKDVVKAYLQTGYEIEQKKQLEKLVLDDAKGELDAKQAANLVGGIEWKNTMENYAHFDLLPAERAGDLPLLEDSILKINQVLMQTGGIDEDRVGGQPNLLFYDRIFRELKSEGFHPSRPLTILADGSPKIIDSKELRGYGVLPPLDEAKWKALKSVGEMRVDNLSFGRGTARLNMSSQRNLKSLATKLESFPSYYVKVLGTTRSEGDPEANRQLAQARATAAATFLTEAGVHTNRVHAHVAQEHGIPALQGGSAQSVMFVVGETDY